MITQSKNKSGSTYNDATAEYNIMKMTYLRLGTYFMISVLLQYFSLNPA
jgi:hypothetical protein